MALRTSIIELYRWLKAQWVADVPDDLAICEFECRKSECSFDDWANCARRISQTPKDRALCAIRLKPTERVHHVDG